MLPESCISVLPPAAATRPEAFPASVPEVSLAWSITNERLR